MIMPNSLHTNTRVSSVLASAWQFTASAVALSMIVSLMFPLFPNTASAVDLGSPTPGTNPPLNGACGLDVALVLDTSTSISSTELSQMKTAVTNFVTTLGATPTQFSLTRFAQTGNVVLAFTDDEAAVNTAVNALTTSSFTNFEDGLAKGFSTFDPRPTKPNVLVFASDGNPNRKGTTGVSATESAAMDAAIVQANAIKTAGTRIITLGIGSDVDADNLKDISSNDAYYSVANFSDLTAALETLAEDLCGGTITVHKIIDEDGNPETDDDQTQGGAGWSFNIGGTPGTTDEFGDTAAVPLENGTYSVTENAVMEGYVFASAFCTKGENDTGTPGNMTVTGVQVSTDDIVSCTFYNRPTNGTLHIVKNVVGVGATETAEDFSFTVARVGDDVTGAGDGDSVTVPEGAYAVSENEVLPNYTTTYSADCEGTMVGGEDKTCTVTNTYNAPQQCSQNVETVVVSDTTTLKGGNPTVPVDISDADGVQLHDAWTASIPGAIWIWGENPPSDTVNDLTETFTKTFTIPGTLTGNATLVIATDNSYSVDINGNLAVCVDATENNFGATDTCVIPQAMLLSGSNTITFTVKNWAQANGTRESNPAGLMYKLTVNSDTCTQPTSCNPETELLQNGGFETPVVTNGSMWDIFPSATSGLSWLVEWFGGSATFGDANRPEVANIELQKTGLSGWVSSEGSQWAELDSDWDGPSGSLNGEPGSISIHQDVVTIPGNKYTLTFDYSPRPGTGAGENVLEVLADGVVVATVGPAAGAGNTVWTSHTVTFTATDTSTRVEFRDAGAPNNSVGTFVDNASLHCKLPDTEEPTTATVHATKVVCTTEAALPNWGDGESGVTIDADTAAEWVAQSDGRCRLESGWVFNWAPEDTPNPGDNMTTFPGGDWTQFPTTGISGTAVVEVPAGNLIWVREEMKPGFVPFTGANTTQDVSAEMYCNTDVLKYDNRDWIDPVVAGEDYYCVAFNAVAPNNEGGGDDEEEDNDGDMCENIEGVQLIVPSGMTQNGDNCEQTNNSNPNPTTTTTSGGGGGGGGGTIMGLIGSVNGGGGTVLGASTELPELPANCTALLNTYMRLGKKNNDVEEVKKLQTFLNTHVGSTLPITGFFGTLTDAAVRAFQSAHPNEVLTPWGLNGPTGYVYKTTQRWINLTHCATLNIPMPDLSPDLGN